MANSRTPPSNPAPTTPNPSTVRLEAKLPDETTMRIDATIPLNAGAKAGIAAFLKSIGYST
jgi:hypothetical protein